MSNLDSASALDSKTISVFETENTNEISTVKSNTSSISIRKGEFIWILFPTIATILIILAITIPTVLIFKKKIDADPTIISTTPTFTKDTTAITTTPTTKKDTTTLTPTATTKMVTTTGTEALLVNSSLSANTKWKQNGKSIAGRNTDGSGAAQLRNPKSIYLDDDNDDETMYITLPGSYRIVEWKPGAKNGQLVAGGKGKGDRNDQLFNPTTAILDNKKDYCIICDSGNGRIMRWSRRNGTNGEIIISDISCFGLAMDNEGYLYVSDSDKNEVRRWRIGDTNGTIVAGGNRGGSNLNQLNSPTYIFVDLNHSVYVSDAGNYRVIKWMKGAREGIVVVLGQSQDGSSTQLNRPYGLIVDHLDNIYVADANNHRIMRWTNGSVQGRIIVGGNGEGVQPNQLTVPVDLSLDRQGNLYVADHGNHRIQKFDIDSN